MYFTLTYNVNFRIENCIKNGEDNRINPGVDHGIWYELRFPTDTAAISIPKTSWTDFPSRKIPAEFSLTRIQEYLAKCNVRNSIVFEDSDSDGDVNINNNVAEGEIGGQKSWQRGRISYLSGHVQQIENNHTDEHFFVRANVNASYKDKKHKVSIVILNTSSIIMDASCTCKAAACKSCSHVIALLFALEDYTTLHGFDPTTSTSKLKTWNMGRKHGRYPMQVLEAAYPHHSKTERNRKRFFSLISPSSTDRTTPTTSGNDSDFKRKLQTMKRPSMFELLLSFEYPDYNLDTNETCLLQSKVQKMISGMVPDGLGPVHLLIDQNSPRWHLERRVRITASVAKSFFTAKELDKVVNDHLWKSNDISHLQAVQYGRDNEANALKEYKQVTGSNVVNAGLVVNSKYPGLGCSPDGLVTNKEGMLTKLIEIKCPFKIKDQHPQQFDPVLLKNMCYRIDENGYLKIKRNHAYYFQVQLSLAIMNLNECDFIIWSPKGMVFENIERDNNFINTLTKKLVNIHCTVLIPEFFEMRLPRKLGLLNVL